MDDSQYQASSAINLLRIKGTAEPDNLSPRAPFNKHGAQTSLGEKVDSGACLSVPSSPPIYIKN